MADALEAKRKRLIYQSWYRGCKETDILLGEFARAHLEHCDEKTLNDYELLLAEDDRAIFDWMTSQSTIPERIQNNRAFTAMQEFHRNRVA